MENKKDALVKGTGGWIQTHSGQKFHIFNPTSKEVSIKDIAHSQSLLCRFGGHCPFFYSVGAHAIIGSYLLEKIYPEYSLDFLLHDSTESFIGDMVSPLKKEIHKFQEIESILFNVIAKKYKLSTPMPPTVKEMDKVMFHIEWLYLMNKNTRKQSSSISKRDFMKIATLSPKKTENLFLKRFRELSRN